jgi:hypothetical protein
LALAVSFDDGEENWKVLWDRFDVKKEELMVGGEMVPTLNSCWKRQNLMIRTRLCASVEVLAWLAPARSLHRVDVFTKQF